MLGACERRLAQGCRRPHHPTHSRTTWYNSLHNYLRSQRCQCWNLSQRKIEQCWVCHSLCRHPSACLPQSRVQMRTAHDCCGHYPVAGTILPQQRARRSSRSGLASAHSSAGPRGGSLKMQIAPRAAFAADRLLLWSLLMPHCRSSRSDETSCHSPPTPRFYREHAPRGQMRDGTCCRRPARVAYCAGLPVEAADCPSPPCSLPHLQGPRPKGCGTPCHCALSVRGAPPSGAGWGAACLKRRSPGARTRA